MATVKRQCQTCVWFREGPRSFEGHCFHPRRKLPTDPQPFVRGRELACRTTWDHDLWEPANTEEDWLIDIQIVDQNDSDFLAAPNNPIQRLLVSHVSASESDL